MSWTNPKETETIIKNMVESIIGDLELFDLAAYENIELNQQYKKELITFFKKIFLKYYRGSWFIKWYYSEINFFQHIPLII